MPPTRSAPLFDALARLAQRRARPIVALAVLVAVLAALLGSSVSEHLQPYAPTAPAGSESDRASERFVRASRVDPAGGLIALIPAEQGPRSPAAIAKLRRVEGILTADPAIATAGPPPGARGPAAVSRDRRRLYVVAGYRPGTSLRDQQEAAHRLIPKLERLSVTLGGSGVVWAQGNETTETDFRTAELLSFPILLLLSLWFFRGGVAALVAALFGGLAIVAALFVLRLLGTATFVSIFALNVVTALGVGLAFDYCLLIISRFREELGAGHPPGEALRRTLGTAGHAVLLSALTIAASLAAMLVFPDQTLSSMGAAGATVTLAACVLALVVLPAVLFVLGERINGLSPSWLRRRRERETRPLHRGAWYRIARAVIRRPVLFATASSVVLLALGTSALRLNLTEGEAELVPADKSGHVVAAAVRRDFAPAHATQPLRVVATGAREAELGAFARRVAALPGVAHVDPPRPLSTRTAVIDVVPRDPPLSRDAQELVRDVRATETPFAVAVGGDTAILLDSKDSLRDHIPAAAGIALLATLVAMFALTQSVVLPLKAVVMNIVSIAATLGLMVLIFQDGRLESLLDYESQGGLILVIPPFVAALSFGLATDYGIFVVSRIKEQVDAGVPDRDAIAIGLERTGRVVTAAALLFSVAVGATVTGHMLPAKQAGLGLVIAVMIDAMIVRAFLVPSLMVLLGRANWWCPPPLRRLVRSPARPPAPAASHRGPR